MKFLIVVNHVSGGDSFALDLGIKNYNAGIKATVENNTKPVDVFVIPCSIPEK